MTRCSNLLALVLWAVAWGVLPVDLAAAEPKGGQPSPGAAQRLFASPDEAAKALRAAATANDRAALCGIFGPVFRELLTGDEVLDANRTRKFAAAMAQGCRFVMEGEDKVTLEVGENRRPMAIPLVRVDGQWHFDTAAGKEEIICRHIGKDELNAIGVCRAYVAAQRQYAGANPEGGPEPAYAQRFKSTPGRKDGLYWPTAENEPASPFGPLVASAQAEGFGRKMGTGSHPFYGYYFRILTRQGKAAPGGERDYMRDGRLTGGFALVAYPARWDQSGIMTFIVNQDGKVFQRNFGGKTFEIAGAMKEYDPDSEWTLVSETGVLRAVSEK